MDGGSTEDAGGGSVAGLGGLEGWRTHSRIVAWCLVLCGSVLLNITLLVAFVRRPGLRTISNRFVMNLIASNLLAIVVLTGLLIVDSCGVSSFSSTTPSLCAISEGATALVTTSSILSVLLIGLDQYLAVVDPLRYRTRIDKLKCGLLILAVWVIALAFGALASFNPEPRGLWSLCSSRQQQQQQHEAMELRISVEISVDEDNATAASEIVDSSEADDYYSESKATMTYGLVYALVYALLGYLLPFVAVCWIYASIYKAARLNSERTRRNGSRPILSSGSFSEEMGRPEASHHVSIEDFRRIPKISSLSSIDENSEICPSSQGNHEDDASVNAAVIFTLGSSKVEGKKEVQQDDAKDNSSSSSKPKVPIAALKAKFLSKEEEEDTAPTRSKFPEVPVQRRKSSHDLMYEEMMLGKHPYEYDDDDDDDELDDEDSEDEELARNFEEALPLSEHDRDGKPNHQGSTRSISVNFEIAEPAEQSRMLVCEKLSSASVASQPPPIVTITPPGQKPNQTLQRVPSAKSTSSYINNLKYRISNGSLFKYREETRAARISALVIVMGLICWTPYVYLLVQRNLPSSGPPRDSTLDACALGFLVLATYISPLLFGYRSKRVKKELRKFFCFKRELSYKNNRSLMAKKVLRRRHSGGTILGQVVGEVDGSTVSKYNIFNYVYGRNRWPKEKVQFVQVPETALAVETCRSSFSSGASTQISSTSTDEC